MYKIATYPIEYKDENGNCGYYYREGNRCYFTNYTKAPPFYDYDLSTIFEGENFTSVIVIGWVSEL